jgi:hypothetical protein
MFARVMESRDKGFCDVIPATREILREWRIIWDNSRHALKWIYLVDCSLAHFWVRLDMKALDAFITDYALTPHRRSEFATEIAIPNAR